MLTSLFAGVVVASTADVANSGHFYKATGNCPPNDRIFDESECRSAGSNQGYAFGGVVSLTNQPPGCFWRSAFANYDRSYLNTNAESQPALSSVAGGLCSSDLQNFDVKTKYPGCGAEILNQGNCGSCWAFSAIGAISDRFCIMGVNVTLSPQTLISCPDSRGACRGGAITNAYKYVASHGLQTCENHCTSGCEPYGSGRSNCQPGEDDPSTDHCYGCDEECHDGSKAIFYKVTSPVTTQLDTDQETVMSELRAHGSVSASIGVFQNWYQWVSQHGFDAVYDTHEGSAHIGGHAIKITGYGVSEGKKYWLVQNSWGDGFGAGGYIKMIRNTTTNSTVPIMGKHATWATPVLQSIFAPEPFLNVSPMDQAPDEITVTGGWFTADHTHAYFWYLALKVFHVFNASGWSSGFSAPTALTRVETQVTAGFNARFSFETIEGSLIIQSQHDHNGELLSAPLVSSFVV